MDQGVDQQRQQGIIAAAKSLEDKDEFCILCPIETRDALRIYKEVCEQEWPEGAKIESPDDYHITILYSHDGFNDPANHIWAKMRSQGNFKVVTGDLDLFGPDKDTAVIRLNSPELEEYAEVLRDEAKRVRGLDISEFAGGYKVHMTIAKGVSKLPVDRLTIPEFRTGDAIVSLPRTKLRFSTVADLSRTPWHINDEGEMVDGNPGETIMNHLRGTYGLTPEQVWANDFDQVGKS